MRNNPEFNSFQEAREKDLSLREIKESIRKLSIEQRQQLSHEINKQIISELHNGMQVKRGDELNFLRALTLEGNTINWTNQKEADSIVPGDVIKIEGDNILKNGNSIGKVQGFKIENNQNIENSNNEETQTQNTQVTEEQNQLQANQEENTTELNEETQQQEQEQEDTENENSGTGSVRETVSETTTELREDFQEIFDNLSGENLGEEERFDVRAYSQDGNYYIIGENGEPVLYSSLGLNENFRESIEAIGESNKKIGNFELIISALVNSEEEEEDYKDIKEEFNNKIQDLDLSSMDSINSLLLWIDEKNNEITDGEPVNLNDKVEVISFIRDIDSNGANNLLVNELFNLTNISEDDLYAFIDNPSNNAESIRTLLGEEKYREVREKIREKKTQADNHFDDNKDLFIRQLIEQNGMDINQATELVEQQYKHSIIDSFVGSYARNEILLSYVEGLSETGNWHGYEGENKLMEMFSDIQGIGYLDASDSTLDSIAFWSKEGFYILGTQIIAIAAGAVTMGAGYVGVNAVVWGTRGHRGIRALQTLSTVANSGSRIARVAQVGRWGAMSAVGGASFYTGYAGVQSVAEGENMYSWEGLGESILYTGAFRALSSIPGLRIDPSKPLSQQKLRLTRATTLDAIAFSSIGLTLEGVLLEPGEWNAELIMQAIVMAAIFRTGGAALQRMKFRTNGNNVEILEGATSTPIKFFRHSQTGKTYTRTLDGKFRNENGRIVSNLKADNLVEVQVSEQARRSTMDRIRTSSRESISNAGERIRGSLGKINENELISSSLSKLNSSRRVAIEKILKFSGNKFSETLNGTKSFLAKLTYKGFGEGGPAFKGKLFYFGGTAVASWEELNTLFDSLNNKDDTIFKLSNTDEVISILSNLFLFKHLGLIRGFAYEWGIDQGLEYLSGNEEILEQETTE